MTTSSMYMFPASFTQQRLWFLDQLEASSAAYNIPVYLRLQMPLDREILEQSLNALIERHEVLRTCFRAVDGQPMQIVAPTLTLSLPVVDLGIYPEDEQEAEALRRANEEAQRPFDLAQAPLMRCLLLKLNTEQSILLLTVHHIIFDGWSVGVLCQELAAFYTAFSTGQPLSLPDLPVQYADFTLWQRERLQADLFAGQLAYWKQQLAGAPAALELPADRPRPAMPTSRGSLHCVTLSRRLSEALKALSRQEGVSLYMTLVAAFQALLHRYSGQDDIVIGTVSAGRTQAEIEALIGFFVNTLVIRTDLAGNPPFRELLKRVREVIFAATEHQEVSFESLVKELRPDRSLGRNPFFQVMLSLNPPRPVLPLGWELLHGGVETGAARFDLSLEIEERLDGLACRFEYSADLFNASTIARMAGHWQTLLESIVADPGLALAQLSLLTQAERHQLLVEWNATSTAYPENTSIQQLFEAQVERTPDVVAVVYKETQLTYRELNARANALAHHLRQLGVKSEVLVGLCTERSLEMVIGLLGILKAGGAYVPLDPAYPPDRLAFMLADAQVMALVTQYHLVERLPAHEARVVCLDTDAQVLAQQSQVNPDMPTTADNVAYVIYTSGSTGRPKGVQVLQRALVNFLVSMRQQPGLSSEDTLLAVTTLSFDIAALELFLPLIVGAQLILASGDVVANGAALAETVTRRHITVMQATPITWRLMLAAGWQGSPDLKILCGGEALPRELAQQLLPKVASLWNMYGPTETTIWSTLCKIEDGDAEISVGRPIANTQAYILDARLQLVPIGVAGELYIGGAGVARGYLKRPQLTAERFIAHPFSDEPDARLYKTGDLARYRCDGTIDLIGRLDSQVKLRGFRIELGEIEAALGQHPELQGNVVVMREDAPGDKRLVAYLVTNREQAPLVNELRSFLREKLPEYMLPSAFVFVKDLPLTPNGKVDRRALPKPNSASAGKETLEQPSLMIHHQLIQVWEELLDARPIGIRDNFFDLGGHSLLAARLLNRIEQIFGKQLSLSALFAGPTIEQLANALRRQVEDDSQFSIVTVQTGASKRPFFYLHGSYKGDGFYCFPLARALGQEQPFYALAPYQFDGLCTPPTVEAMAAFHLELIRAAQPHGPYLLGGFCNGGLIAYEIARQLHTAGQQVNMLTLIDPTPFAHSKSLYKIFKRACTLVRMDQERQVDVFLWLRHMYRYLQHVYKHMRFPTSRRLETEFPGPLFPTTQALRQDWEGLFFWAMSEYVPAPYAGKSALLFSRASKAPWRRQWHKVMKEAHISFIAGTHETCKTEHLHDLAASLAETLSQAQQEARKV